MSKRILISGGGTGGHIFPAVAIANALKEYYQDADILFIGANGRMEMKRVPEAGFDIKGLNIYGFQRKISFKNFVENLKLPFRVFDSMQEVKKIIREFAPDIAIGVGGYASGPALKMAAKMNVPTLIHEANSFPGMTNRLLADKVDCICITYDSVKKYFPKEKTVKTGNPIRGDILNIAVTRDEALDFFGLQKEKKTIAVIGGSLGARTINESITTFVEDLSQKGIQLIWQTGEYYYNSLPENLKCLQGIKVFPFIRRMDMLYTAADVVISRAGALSLTELCTVGKPCILVPSPNVAEDHQTKNAQALEQAGAALLVPDVEAKEKLKDAVLSLVNDDEMLAKQKTNLLKLAQPNATELIVKEVVKLIK